MAGVAKRTMRCGEHGDVGAAFVCEHLTMSGSPRGFFWSTSDEPHGWCADCEAVREAEGEWNERSAVAYGKIRMVCTMCFERLRAIHFPSH